MKNNKILYSNAKKINSFRELIDESAKKFRNKNAFIIKEKVEKNPKYKYITYEHLKSDVDSFGQGLISAGLKEKRIAIATSEYHIYRAKLIAKELGLLASAIPAKSIPVLRVSYFTREVFGVWYLKIRKTLGYFS